MDGDLVFYLSYGDKLGLLSPNATTPYLIGFLNLSRTGPLVIDVPAGQIAGAILDFWQRPVADLGLTGPDGGAGGKYLLLGPGQEVQNTSGYIVRLHGSHLAGEAGRHGRRDWQAQQKGWGP